MQQFYLMKMGFVSYELFYLFVFKRDSKEFSEYSLHHLSTLGLVLFSYVYNFLNIGSIVMFIHDFTNVTVHLCKLCVMVSPTPIIIATFTLMASTWMYLLNYFFAIHIIKDYWDRYDSFTHPTITGTFHIFFTCFSALELLHLYWLHQMYCGFRDKYITKTYVRKNTEIKTQ